MLFLLFLQFNQSERCRISLSSLTSNGPALSPALPAIIFSAFLPFLFFCRSRRSSSSSSHASRKSTAAVRRRRR